MKKTTKVAVVLLLALAGCGRREVPLKPEDHEKVASVCQQWGGTVYHFVSSVCVTEGAKYCREYRNDLIAVCRDNKQILAIEGWKQ